MILALESVALVSPFHTVPNSQFPRPNGWNQEPAQTGFCAVFLEPRSNPILVHVAQNGMSVERPTGEPPGFALSFVSAEIQLERQVP